MLKVTPTYEIDYSLTVTVIDSILPIIAKKKRVIYISFTSKHELSPFLTVHKTFPQTNKCQENL